jgi:glycosyltransferase involved in cell wall biosynthesis
MKKKDSMNNLNILAPINSLGYGVAAKNTARFLTKFFDVSLFTIGNANFESEEEYNLFAELLHKSPMSFDPTAPCLKIFHEFRMAERVGKGDLIAYSFFELNKMNDMKRHHLSQCDKVVVASEWAKSVVEDQVKDSKVYVAPLAVDHTVFYPTNRPQEKFIIFNCGKWEIRKGHDIILEVFQAAFPDNKDVELWMMTQNPVASPEYNKKWNDYYRQDFRVNLINRVQDHRQLAQVMNQATCGFFPSRAEGWNLELLEMMACGKPVVTTDYASHTEFCTDDNSIKFKPNKFEEAIDNTYFKGGEGEWASLDDLKDNFVEALRSLYKQWQTDRTILNQHGIITAQNLNWLNTAEKVKEAIND